MKNLSLLLALVIPFLFSNCKQADADGDVTFAKQTFESLARGNTSVADDIDWETFTSLGVPVGQRYVTFKNDAERADFTNSFITQFSSSFRESGGSADNFTNWKVDSHDETHTKVTADSSGGILKLTVSERDGKERLSAIEVIKQTICPSPTFRCNEPHEYS
ncbi:hypothetical protein ACFSSA_10090 [Luteolibacter algae]|uniref:Uncharacterized protein n=1 Tax=Luteolibacter algae TaxID=454151 RepID=A0ABW5D9B5_9BACT